MEKLIVRNIVSKKSKISSKMMEYIADSQLNTRDEFFNTVGIKKIFHDIFDENVDEDILEKTALYVDYILCKESGKSNSSFVYMYKIDEEFCIGITEHIYLYHIVKNIAIGDDLIVPWSYVDSKIYFGDTWWEEDGSVISDFQSLSILDFVKKYKMF